ncbi:MAG: ABC transporter ATP-binding protein [Limnothrix sp. CACIAM 69d]|nr:MAG: ABC transporter ATP-binding protein [Limnothrix sp. CACIAM 69d]
MISLQNITKTYQLGDSSVPILKGINLDIPANDYLAIVGSSGSGKSTLMNIIGCLDRPTEGTYTFENRNLTALNPTELAYIRNQRIGFVFQQFNLLPRATALENVMLPAVYAGIPKADRRARAEAALVSVGLGDRLHNRPNQLSGGQQQRVAIARALINQPSLLLADEPTGALDSQTTQEVMALFDQLHEQNIAIVLITHDLAIADRTQRKIQVRDGLIVD